MQQFAHLWNSLDIRKRIIVLGATALVVLGVLALARQASQPNYALLYSGLSPKSSGEVIAALDAQGVQFDVRNSAIYVEASKRDALRLTLAAEGLPAGDINGYELLDNLSGFGTTSQMFDAAYLRAKEGELSRTIMANPQISAARVHIAPNVGSPFRSASTQTASVSLRGTGGAVPEQTAEAIRFLVSAAVTGLQPENVSVIDADRGTVIAQSNQSTPQQLGWDRAETLKRNVERLVEAHAGTGNAVVEVNVETLTDEEMIVERRFDPEGRVIVSTQTQETSRNAQNGASGDVTVASNLPEGDGAGGGAQSNSQDSETQETVNYELSETTRELRKAPGSIKRISVAVLVDGVQVTSEDGTTSWQPRQEAELAMLEDLVKSAVGFDEGRGDSVTIRSMEMPALLVDTGTSEPQGWMAAANVDVMQLTKLGIVASVVLGLGLFVVRPIMATALAAPPALAALPPGGVAEQTPPALSGEVTSPPARDVTQVSGQLPAPGTTTETEQDPIERLKQLIDERQEDTVEILRSWIETPERAG